MSLVLDETPLLTEHQQLKSKRLAVASPYLHKLQKRHFVLLDVLPAFGAAVAIGLAFVRPVTTVDVVLFCVFWLITGLGISAGYHRLFTHRSYKTPSWVRVALAIAGCMAGQGAVISWVAMHRRHHELADNDGDMHSPNLHGLGWRGRLQGFLHAHYTWMIRHDYPNVAHYARDLLREPLIVRVGRLYTVWVLLGLALPALIGGLVTGTWYGALSGFLWGGVMRMFVVGHSMWALNSFLHTMGSQPFRLRENPSDNSRNNWALGLLAWGEGWHNNHHAFPYSASFGLAWYRADIAYWFIAALRRVGLAWDVRLPTPERIAAARALSSAETPARSPGVANSS
jgi:stearoyl-CoA desaturase (delta-9 desaturase)